MNNAIYDTTAKNFTAAAEIAKKTAAINVATLDKLINFQFSTATNWIGSGFNQFKTFTGVKSVDELAAVSSTLLQSVAKQGQDQAQELRNLVMESGAAYQAVLETANASRQTTTNTPATVKSATQRPAPAKAKTKPESKSA